jgi:hypothetical protein
VAFIGQRFKVISAKNTIYFDAEIQKIKKIVPTPVEAQ